MQVRERAVALRHDPLTFEEARRARRCQKCGGDGGQVCGVRFAEPKAAGEPWWTGVLCRGCIQEKREQGRRVLAAA